MNSTEDMREIKVPRHPGVPFSLVDSWLDQRVAPYREDAEDQSEMYQWLLSTAQEAVRRKQCLTALWIHFSPLFARLGLWLCYESLGIRMRLRRKDRLGSSPTPSFSTGHPGRHGLSAWPLYPQEQVERVPEALKHVMGTFN